MENKKSPLVKKFIKVSFQFEGFHKWPEAIDHAESYLALRHRHMFHCTALKRVGHNDRDIEFIELKRMMSNYIKLRFGLEFGTMSCESIAEHLMNYFCLDEIEISEDGENGAILRK